MQRKTLLNEFHELAKNIKIILKTYLLKKYVIRKIQNLFYVIFHMIYFNKNNSRMIVIISGLGSTLETFLFFIAVLYFHDGLQVRRVYMLSPRCPAAKLQ